ncbi:MAG: XrtA-associated tyrosine autokinase [Gammaproteobacteria bacterium]|nr:XrtA-associated tyrosine autokinase [Gammaproteobacteria bacterium]
MAYLPGEGDPLDISEISLLDIDIRLDKDLSNYEDQTNVPRYADLELDIDLTSPGNREPSHVEDQVLTINPTRSFSHQIDVDLKKLSMAGFITPDNVSTELSNTFRQLKRPVINNVKGKGATVLDNANMVMVTSSVAEEGKTFSAINMAMSIAMETDNKVLLIDADISKPSHHEFFGIEMKNGLTDFLMGRVKDLSEIIYKTNIPSLSLMFAGSKTPHAVELFASTAMENLISELSKRYDDRVIVFDSAPLLLPTEASVLASHMGQIILIIEAEKTRHEMVKRSMEMLSNRIVLLVLNKMREKNVLGAYGPYGKYEE